MARGGARKGAGRKPGSTTTRTREIAEKAFADGQMPLEYMLEVMRDKTAEGERRDKMAANAAPYVHPKLAAIEHTGKDGGPIETREVSDVELAQWLADRLLSAAKRD